MNTVGIILARLGLDTRDFKAGLAEATGVTGKFSAALLGIPNLGGVLSAAGIGTAIVGITNYAEKVEHLSERFGVSTTVIQQWGRAAEENGSSLEAVALAFNKLEVARSKAQAGDENILAAFNRLGVSINDVVQLKPDELMRKIGAGSGDAASMVAVLGRNGTELRPIIQGIADGTIKFQKAIDEIDLKKLAEADRLFKELAGSAKVFIAEDIAAPIIKGFETTKGAFDQLQSLKSKSFEIFKNLFTFDFSGAKKAAEEGRKIASEFVFGPGKTATAASSAAKARGPRPEEDTAAASALQDKIEKERTVVEILRLQLGHQDALATALKTQLAYEEKVIAARKIGSIDLEKEALLERDITFALQAQSTAMKNKEKLQSRLSELAAIPQGAAGAAAGFSPSMIYAGHQARQAQEEEARAQDIASRTGRFDEAQMHVNRAEDIKSGIDQLKDSEKDLSGAVRMGVDASEIMKKIEENTAKDLVAQ